MDKTLIHILKNIGLNDKEARIYLSALELGTSVVSNVAKKAEMNRVTAYDILEKLMKKGFVNSFMKFNIRHYTATDPELIINEIINKTTHFKESLPALKRLKGETTHPKVQYFEGLEGIKAIYADTLNSKSEILNFANSQEIRRIWPEYDDEYVAKRVEKQIYLRGIAPQDEYGMLVHSHDGETFREIRLIPKDKYNFTNEINIYDNKVAIASFKDELIGMIIESHEIAETQRAIFRMVWEFAELINPASVKTRTLTARKQRQLETEDPQKIAAQLFEDL